jgi:hypothetical protein
VNLHANQELMIFTSDLSEVVVLFVAHEIHVVNNRPVIYRFQYGVSNFYFSPASTICGLREGISSQAI